MVEWRMRTDSAVKPSGQLGKSQLEWLHRMDECKLSVLLRIRSLSLSNRNPAIVYEKTPSEKISLEVFFRATKGPQGDR